MKKIITGAALLAVIAAGVEGFVINRAKRGSVSAK